MTPTSDTISDSRIVLRRWRDSDLLAFAAMNADPEVMRHFPATLNSRESADLLTRIRQHFDQHGYGVWALEITGQLPFAGFVGLLQVNFEAHFSPAVEIAWRLVHSAWGKSYATKAALRVLHHAFEELQLEEVVSFTVPANQRSQAVMQRIGMHTHIEDNFEHPRLPTGHPLREHVLYRLKRDEWLTQDNKTVSQVVLEK